MLQTESLERFRNDVPIYSNISFNLIQGQHLVLSGSNGSGKTSLIRTLCCLTNPSSGCIKWNKSNVNSIDNDYLDRIAYLGHKNGLIDELTLMENIEVTLGKNFDRSELTNLLDNFNLFEHKDILYSNLSNGQKRKTALIRVILSSKQLWIMDEPFTNLDVDSIAFIDIIINSHLNKGGMLISASHSPENRIDCDLEINLDGMIHVA
jgi:heme exporter protein A